MGPIKKRAAMALVGAAAIALALPATDASAIDRVDCAGRTDFVTIWNEGEVCFANSGYTDVAIYNVREVGSGNNDLYYGYSIGPNSRHLYAWEWQSGTYRDSSNGIVRWVQTFRP